MCCGLLSGSTCMSQAEVLTNLPGFFHLPYAPSDLLFISLERAGAGGGHSLKEHLSPVCRSEKVIGQVEASQRGWIQPTDYELDNAELVKITWTQLVWNIQLHTCIKYQLVHATVMWVHLDCYRFSVTTLWFPFWKLVFWNTALWLQITDM